jgi:catechol 2,3-dioxygenase-like lactoylglutathione lyase family enzyme
MSTFEQRHALQAFRAFLGGRGLNEATLSVRDGLEAMLDFYRDMRPSGCVPEPHGDMLLLQWGTYLGLRPDGLVDELANLNLTRQLIPEVQEDDDDIWQLGLTFEFSPADFRGLKDGDRWCQSLAELAQFREYVLASAPVAKCSQLQVQRARLIYECVG